LEIFSGESIVNLIAWGGGVRDAGSNEGSRMGQGLKYGKKVKKSRKKGTGVEGNNKPVSRKVVIAESSGVSSGAHWGGGDCISKHSAQSWGWTLEKPRRPIKLKIFK